VKRQAHPISLWLDTYDDLFSDFDPRHLSERGLSHDFLAELKRATTESRPGKVHLVLILPNSRRKRRNESIIKERLIAHFTRHDELLRTQRRTTILRGLLKGAMGLFAMLALVVFTENRQGIHYRAFSLLGEAAGWFFFWSGMDQIFNSSPEKKAEFAFYAKMADATIEFQSSK